MNPKNMKKSEFIYNQENALSQIELDSEDFVSAYKEKLDSASSIFYDMCF